MTNTHSTSKSTSQHRGLSGRLVAGWVQNSRECGSFSSFLFLPLFLLSGCPFGPNYQRPKVNVPTEYRSAEGAAQQASIADLPWWEVFKDDRLRNLVQTALANNYDLRIAVTRIEQSRQIAAQARAQFFAFLNYSASGSDGKNEFAGAIVPNGGQERGAFLAVATVAWEADVWGRSAAKMKPLVPNISLRKKPAGA